MADFNLLNLKDIAEPLASVTNNFINKIADAMGWLVSPKGIKPYVLEARKSIIDEIANREDIDPIERFAIVSNLKKIVKEYETQVDIVKIALNHLEKTAEPEKVDADWITFFFDRVKSTNNDELKSIWGKLIAGEFNEPNTYTKQLIHTLSIMDSDQAMRFQKLRSSCFYVAPNLYTFVYRSDNDKIKNLSRYKELGLDFKDFRELENLGLIQYRYPTLYAIKNSNKPIQYGNKTIRLTTSDKSLLGGNVSLTDVGKQLCRIIDMQYDDRVLDICKDSWVKLGYKVSIKMDSSAEHNS